MIVRRFFIFSLVMAGCAAAAYAIGRDLDKRRLKEDLRQFKEDLRNWEHEGGNLAPARAAARRVAPA